MDNGDSGNSGSLTGMRCAEVSRTSGIILTTTTTFSVDFSVRNWARGGSGLRVAGSG